METYTWSRKYNAESGFIDTLVPRKRFTDGEAICFVVSTPLPASLSKYLRVQIDWAQMCALKQSSMEALIRLEEASRVEKHHGVSGAHRHHGILPYDPRNATQTGCRTDNAQKLHVKRMTLENSLRLEDYSSESEIPPDSTFTVVDSSSGTTALCAKASAISPSDIPVYVEVMVSVFHQEENVAKLMERQSSQEDVENVGGLLAAYGVFGTPDSSKTSATKSLITFPDGPSDTEKKWTTLVVSDLKDDSYVLCPESSRYDKHGYCVQSNFSGETWLWTMLLSGGALVLGAVIFCIWPAPPNAVVI